MQHRYTQIYSAGSGARDHLLHARQPPCRASTTWTCGQTRDYKALGIAGEPYLDVDFTQVFYLTDTGRRWNHAGASIRDRVDSGFDIRVKSTGHLMALARDGRLPERIMINTHPQRWEDRVVPWVRELVWQNIKNVFKGVFIKG